jgi:hypothetical protein
MSRMFRSYRPADVIGDFSGTQTVDGSARAIREDGKHFIEIRRDDNGAWTRYPVDFLIGSKWQQAYATRLLDSRLLVFPVQYSRLRSAWVNYWKSVDAPGSGRAEIGRFHEIPADAVYQDTCAACHTSQLKLDAAPGEATFREGGINCEMCHGPSLDHVERYGSPGSAHAGADGATPVRFGRLTSRQYVAVCAQCHAQSAVHDAQPGGAVNYSEAGAPVRTYPKELPSNFSRHAFYRDGRYRATTFISEAFGAPVPARAAPARVVPRSPSAERRQSKSLKLPKTPTPCACSAMPRCANAPSGTHVMLRAPKPAGACRVTCRRSWKPCCSRRARTRSMPCRMRK